MTNSHARGAVNLWYSEYAQYEYTSIISIYINI